MLGPHPVVMTPRLFRPATPRSCPDSPSWKQWRGLLYVTVCRRLAPVVGLLSHPHVRLILLRVLLGVGMVSQVGLLLLAGYLIDLSVSLMELWAELARKHLELTL